MAKQTSLIKFTGRLGNVIGYCRNNDYFLRAMPETVRQTTATRRAAHRFGMASKKGALIRRAFTSELDVRCDSSHINRLNRALILAGSNNMAAITGFRFNQHAGTDKFLTVAPKLSRDGILHIPPQVLPQYKGITALEVKVIAARINFVTHEIICTETAMIVLDTREPFAGAALSVDVPGNGALIVTLQIRGVHKGYLSCDKKYQAADIVAVSEPEVPRTYHKPSYPPQALLRQSVALSRTANAHPRHMIQRE